MRATTVVLLGLVITAATDASGQECRNGREPRPDLGIRTFQCNGGTCILPGVSAMRVPGRWLFGGITRSAPRDRAIPDYSFTVEPILRNVSGAGPAAGSVQEGDVLLAVNGDPVTTAAATRHLSAMTPGRALTLTLRRNGQTVTAVVEPALTCEPLSVSAGSNARPTEPVRTLGAPAGEVQHAGMVQLASLGLAVVGEKQLDVQLNGETTWWFVERPVIVRLDRGSPAADAGFAVGDVLLTVNEQPVTSVRGTVALLSAANDGATLRLRRGTQELAVRLPPR